MKIGGLIGVAVLGIVLSACSVSIPSTHMPANAAVQIGPSVLVSGENIGWNQSEFTSDIDPTNPKRMIVCIQAHDPATNQTRNGVYLSTGGGTYWTYAVDAGYFYSSGYFEHGDPACTFGLHNEAFYSTLRGSSDKPVAKSTYESWPHEASYPQRMDFYRSTDSGSHWSGPMHLGFIDHDTIVVDRGHDRYRGRMYIYGNPQDRFVPGQNRLWMLYSTDEGRTFKQSVATPVDSTWHHYGKGALLPDGTLIIPYQRSEHLSSPPDLAPTGLAVTVTSDGGHHLSRLVPVSLNVPMGGLPYMAADNSHGPFRGRAYIIWPQWDEGDWKLLPPVCNLMESYSDDDGQTWSSPIVVSDAVRNDSSIAPLTLGQSGITVNNQGVVAVAYSDSRDGDEQSWRFAASLDGGQTWLPSVSIPNATNVWKGEEGVQTLMTSLNNGAAIDGTTIAWVPNDGDYATFFADPSGMFHAFWLANDGKTGAPSALYTAPIRVTGKVLRNGDPSLASLSNISSKVEMQFRSDFTSWQGNAMDVRASFVLLNISKVTIHGPLRMRFIVLRSPLGPMMLVRSDGELGSVGSVVDLNSDVPAGGLKPGAHTLENTLHFRVAPIIQSIADKFNTPDDMTDFRALIFGPK